MFDLYISSVMNTDEAVNSGELAIYFSLWISIKGTFRNASIKWAVYYNSSTVTPPTISNKGVEFPVFHTMHV